jgi:hypothetical protein
VKLPDRLPEVVQVVGVANHAPEHVAEQVHGVEVDVFRR